MKRYTGLILLGLLMVVAGCASLTAPIERWVGGNTFHSERFPAVNIKVSDALPFVGHEQEKRKPEADRGAIGSRDIQVDSYVFGDRSNGNYLLIKTEFMREDKWFFYAPNYATWDGVLKHGDEKLLGKRYSTGIFSFRNPQGKVSLIKAWGRTAGNATRFQIFYGEQVDQSWAGVSMLNAKQEKALQAFNERAANSFEVIP